MPDDQDTWDFATAKETPVTPEPVVEATPTPEPTPEPPAPVETTGGRLKDPVSGKFVAKTPSEPPRTSPPEEPPAPPVEPQPTEEAEVSMPAQVPSWRLAEEAQRRRDAEAQQQELTQQLRQMQMQMAQMQERFQQPQEPIDPIADPEGYQRNVQAAWQREMANLRLENSLERAQDKYGETFDSAYAAFVEQVHPQGGADQATYLRVMRTPNPGRAMVQWYQERENLAKVGNDPEAWLKAELDKRMSDPAFQAQVIQRVQNGAAPSSPTTQVQLPPSLSRATSAAPAVGAPADGSEGGIWAYATAKR